jgi:hypothetical protein
LIEKYFVTCWGKSRGFDGRKESLEIWQFGIWATGRLQILGRFKASKAKTGRVGVITARGRVVLIGPVSFARLIS